MIVFVRFVSLKAKKNVKQNMKKNAVSHMPVENNAKKYPRKNVNMCR